MTDGIDRRSLIGMISVAPLAATVPASAANCPGESEAGCALRVDFAGLERYAGDNRTLAESGRPVGIVFIGDSITRGWLDNRPGFFTEGRVNRGIGGQTTPQMLLRIMADVVALKPRLVHVMAGTNDIAGNTGPMTERMTRDNLTAMITLAQANEIGVILASIPPAAHFPWRPGLDTRTPIASLNRWIADHARKTGATWVDYHEVLADGAGGMKPGFAFDGVHPTEAGYDAMATLLGPRLESFGI